MTDKPSQPKFDVYADLETVREVSAHLEAVAAAIRPNPEAGPIPATLIGFLASLYDGTHFPFALERLRALTRELQVACLTVLRYDMRGLLSVHELGVFTEDELQNWMEGQGLYFGAQCEFLGRSLYKMVYPEYHTHAGLDARHPARGVDVSAFGFGLGQEPYPAAYGDSMCFVVPHECRAMMLALAGDIHDDRKALLKDFTAFRQQREARD